MRLLLVEQIRHQAPEYRYNEEIEYAEPHKKGACKPNIVRVPGESLIEQKNIDDCIDNQNPQISAVKISKEVFTELAKDSEAVKAIDFATGARIRAKYSLEDELSMSYKANDNPEKIAFLEYREEQIELGRNQKKEMGL